MNESGKGRPRPRPRRTTRTPKPKLMAVAAAAPSHIKWLDEAGKALGKGNGTLRLPASSTKVLAYDPRRGVHSPATITGGKVSYSAIPTGTIVLRVFPYAEMVMLGKDKLGPPPLKPQKSRSAPTR